MATMDDVSYGAVEACEQHGRLSTSTREMGEMEASPNPRVRRFGIFLGVAFLGASALTVGSRGDTTTTTALAATPASAPSFSADRPGLSSSLSSIDFDAKRRQSGSVETYDAISSHTLAMYGTWDVIVEPNAEVHTTLRSTPTYRIDFGIHV